MMVALFREVGSSAERCRTRVQTARRARTFMLYRPGSLCTIVVFKVYGAALEGDGVMSLERSM
jgi:hypothetical protein